MTSGDRRRRLNHLTLHRANQTGRQLPSDPKSMFAALTLVSDDDFIKRNEKKKSVDDSNENQVSIKKLPLGAKAMPGMGPMPGMGMGPGFDPKSVMLKKTGSPVKSPQGGVPIMPSFDPKSVVLKKAQSPAKPPSEENQ